jgi:RNA polymerase-binding transcription factor DksA
MTDDKIRIFEKRLSDMRDRLVREKQQLLAQVSVPVDNPSYNDISTSSLRPGTVGVSEGDEEVAIGVYDNIEHTHAEIVAALERIAAWKFGLCERCGKRIAQMRLKAIPYARQCAGCLRERAVSGSNAR